MSQALDPPRPGTAQLVRVLVDAGDDAAVTRALLASHDLAAGHVVVHPSPGSYGVEVLAMDILAALGCSRARRPFEHIYLTGWSAAMAWAPALHVQQLVVLRAHLLPPTCWHEAAEIAGAAGAALVMVCHTDPARLRPTIAALLASTPHQLLTDVTDVLPCPPPRPPAAPRALERQQVYARAERAACAWLGSHPLLEPGRPDWDISGIWADHQGLHLFLAALVLHSPDRDLTAQALAGAAAGFAHHGLSLHLPQHMDTRAGPGLPAGPVTDALIDRIRSRLTSPQHATALALTLITGIWTQVLATLRVDGVSPDAATVTLPAGSRTEIPDRVHRYGLDPALEQQLGPTFRPLPVTFGIPAPARPLLQAARRLALLNRSTPTEPLLREGYYTSRRVITDATVQTVAAACAVPLPPRLHPLGIPWTLYARCLRLTTTAAPDDLHPWHQWADVPLTAFDP